MRAAAYKKKKELLDNRGYEISEKMAEEIACLEGAYAALPKANTFHAPYNKKKARIANQYKNSITSYYGLYT